MNKVPLPIAQMILTRICENGITSQTLKQFSVMRRDFVLSLAFDKIKDIFPSTLKVIASITTCKTLSLSECTNIKSGLSALNGRIQISKYITIFSSLSFFLEMTNLKHLNLSQTQISDNDFKQLVLPNLVVLNLSGNPYITDDCATTFSSNQKKKQTHTQRNKQIKD